MLHPSSFLTFILFLDTLLTLNAQNCYTPNLLPGMCTNYRYCDYVIALIYKYYQTQDMSINVYIQNLLCGYENDEPLVCCPMQVAMTTTPVPAPAQGAFYFGGGPTEAPAPAPAPTTTLPVSSGFQFLTNARDQCGISNASFLRVVGGENAALHAWPWMAALGYKSSTDFATRFLCGGSLITSMHVLSAGHCIKESLVSVRLGEHDITSNNDGAQPLDVSVAWKIAHDQFDPKTVSNDIGLIKLKQAVTFNNMVRPICLPFREPLLSRDLTDYQPFIAGWGATSFNGPSAKILQQAQIPILPMSECIKNYKVAFPAQVFDNRVLCAGFPQGGVDSCQGDSGGPLMLPELSADYSYYYFNLVGIVSYGFECAKPGFPGVYARVTTFLPWIEKHLND